VDGRPTYNGVRPGYPREKVSTGFQNITEFRKLQIGHIKKFIIIICECKFLKALLLQIYLEYYAVYIILPG